MIKRYAEMLEGMQTTMKENAQILANMQDYGDGMDKAYLKAAAMNLEISAKFLRMVAEKYVEGSPEISSKVNRAYKNPESGRMIEMMKAGILPSIDAHSQKGLHMEG